MKTLQIMTLFLAISGYANAGTTTARLTITGETLPKIQHLTDMKISGDTLLFVYESRAGFGQRFLRRAVIDTLNNTLDVSPDMGKREDGYYTSYMPYPFIDENGRISVIGQDDCEIFSVANETALVRSKKSLLGGSCVLPFALSQYVQDIFNAGPDKYVFIGREPKGGRQYAMTADLSASRVDTICQISISPELQQWMPNAGELTYSRENNRFAFAYRLHPIFGIFDTSGNLVKSIRIADDTFDKATLEEADFESLNTLHAIDATSTTDYIFLLEWNCKYSEAATTNPTIYKIDWDGSIVDCYDYIPTQLYRIAAIDELHLIAWTGNEFIRLKL